jgi:diaminopimelate epimerase
MAVAGFDFHKYEGLGNDFVILEVERDGSVPLDFARRLCDRRRGIGADGVLVFTPSADAGDGRAAGRMVVINADGSIPEMCGNGIRCLAWHVARKRGQANAELSFETGAGPKVCVVEGATGGASARVTVDMSPVRWVGDVHLDLGPEDGGWEFSLADAGNPHAITLHRASRAGVERIGPLVATHPRFAGGTNVEFAACRSPTEIELVVWERGVGITDACGTGACATVVVGVEKGWAAADEDVAVSLPGGMLHVNVSADKKRVLMSGPANHVFSGRVSP